MAAELDEQVARPATTPTGTRGILGLQATTAEVGAG
jgi:hypothetical protein